MDLSQFPPIRRYMRKDLDELLVAVAEGVSTGESQQEPAYECPLCYMGDKDSFVRMELLLSSW